MSYLNQMYGRRSEKTTGTPNNKNPNRVAGGLKAQGVDHVAMVNEDGSMTEVATRKYVASLEDQLRKVRTENTVLSKKINRLDKSHSDLQSFVSSKL